MLRALVFGFGCLLLFGALIAAFCGATPLSFQLLIFGLLCAGGVAFERWRYGSTHSARPGPGWESTGERFIDPETSCLVAVYYEPSTGKRRYVNVGATKNGGASRQ